MAFLLVCKQLNKGSNTYGHSSGTTFSHVHKPSFNSHPDDVKHALHSHQCNLLVVCLSHSQANVKHADKVNLGCLYIAHMAHSILCNCISISRSKSTALGVANASKSAEGMERSRDVWLYGIECMHISVIVSQTILGFLQLSTCSGLIKTRITGQG